MEISNLETKLEQIKADPHGQTARDASHWLALNVMGWETIEFTEGETVAYCDTEKVIFVCELMWEPFTNANHTLMLWQALCEKCEISIYELAYELSLNLLTQSPLEVVLSLLNDEGVRHYTKLTDDEISRWGL